jgi:dolichyl-diphosphooligosaccharide--protein glycosyltransferase
MDFTALTKNKRWLIPAIIFVFMGVAFFIRLVPVFSLNSQGFLPIFDTDTWYNLRQIEVMVNHFPQYNWFDPMTAFPYGKIVDWGPLYPALAAILCLATGATNHTSIIFMSGWLSVLMGVAMVPVMYYLGKTIWNWPTGLESAGLISVVSYQYFFYSSYGVVDHHIAEVLFSSLFILAYIGTINFLKQNPLDRSNHKTFFLPVLLSALTGILWFLALIASTTVLLILLIVAIYTIIQNISDHLSSTKADYLVVVNCIFLCFTVFLLFAFGFVQEGTSFTRYTVGLVYVHLALVGLTLLFYGISRGFQGKQGLYLAVIAGLTAVSVVLLSIVPSLQAISNQAINLLFGTSQFTVGVEETLPLTLAGAITNFNTTIILAFAGFIILLYFIAKKRENSLIFLAIWSAIILMVTLEHQRFEYYLTVNLVLLSAVCISETIGMRKEEISRLLTTGTYHKILGEPAITTNEQTVPGKSIRAKKDIARKIGADHKLQPCYRESLKDLAVVSVILLVFILVGFSFSQDYGYAVTITHQGIISPDWTESLSWINSTTPLPGIDYFQQYDQKKFSYPNSSYGIMAVWDAGHWITFFSNRLPVTNPFQDNLAGSNGAAAYFLSENETDANSILQSFRGKYVVTNSVMAVDIFTGLVPWVNPSSDISPYIKYFLQPDPANPSHLTKVHLYDNDYFQTQVVRLHMFDGSMTVPGTADYLKYVVRKVPAPGETSGDVNGYARVITSEKIIDILKEYNGTTIISEKGGLAPQGYANVFSRLPNKSVQGIPALKQYRLVHESPDDAVVTPFPESKPFILPDIKQVKIFEFVQGAHIPGTGIIEVPVITNTGRTFIYRQESEAGEFVVPYSTTGSTYEVKTTAPYHIAGTSRYYNVTEDEVIKGKQVIALM